MNRLALTFFIFLVLLLAAPSAHAISFEKAIKNVNQQDKYFFYLHGAIMEKKGKNAVSDRYGSYLYDHIIEHFEDRGLIVIEEVRGPVNPNKYASKIVMQVRRLMAAGVPAGNICVTGFSKGGYITLLVASSLGNPGVGYVIMAGCGRGKCGYVFDQFLKKKRGARLRGRILSIYAGSDMDAGSCRQAFEQAPDDGFSFKELRIKTGKGHGLFYQPRPEWVAPVAIWAKGGR
ncbi:MAG: hypothetical protein JEY79_16865 [Pseudodesulfovibrio sp.]|nr:hypothetical protein [Pseudodesulfovibrio sp.]